MKKTSFITPFGTFCFVRMPEGLKKAGCTFSRMIAIVLHLNFGETFWNMWMT
jgi:hypothetical protein